MTYFLAQVALLLLAAYLLGTFLGCMIHRLFGYVFASSDAPAQTGGVNGKTAQPVIETSDHSAALPNDLSRFEKALSHGPAAREWSTTEPARSKTATATPAPVATPVVKLDTPSFTPVDKPEPTDTEPASSATSKTATLTPITAPTPEPAKKTPPATTSKTTPVTPAVTPPEEGEKYQPVSAAAAIAAAAAAAAVTASAGRATTSKPTPKSTPKIPVVPPTTRNETAAAPATTKIPVSPVAVAPAASQGDPDDLTRIRHIDGALQGRLNDAGVTRYEHIASWQADDVAKFDGLNESPGRVSRENWIEQAQILSIGGATAYSRDKDAGVSSQPAAKSGALEKPPKAQSSSSAQAGVMAATAAAAAAAMVSAPTAGTDTGKQETSKTSSSTTTSKADAGVMAATAAAAAAAAAATAISSRLPATDTTKPAAPITPRVHEFDEIGTDPLHRIDGIDNRAAGLLNGHGITRFEQIANWSKSDVSHFEELVGEPGRVGRQRWVEQARSFARSDTDRTGNTQPMPASKADATAIPVVPIETKSPSARSSRPARDASEPRHGDDDSKRGSGERARPSKLSGMRSVRSAALRGDRDAPHGARFDDLKRIRGVGVLIEKKLNSLGVTSYDQIANWTNDDMDQISGLLEFKGRIERENWVEQARILASGGHTEFSRRMERGQ